MHRVVPVALVALLALSLVPPTPAAAGPLPPLSAPIGNSLGDIGATLALPRATVANDANGDKVFDDLMDRFLAEPALPLSVIVTFRDGTDMEGALADAQRRAGAFQLTFVFPRLYGFAAILSLDQVLRIAQVDAVRQVEWDAIGVKELDTATVNFGARTVQETLTVTGDLDGKPQAFSARDVTVAIMDTGFDGKHVDLAGKFLAFVDAADKAVKEPFDSDSHGTHVASIVGGLGVGQAKYRGVAPGAAFIGIKIVGSAPYGGATGSKAGALFGVDWILQNQKAYNIRISTISFGFGATNDGTDALELAFDRAFAAGILPFKSNGNSGPERGTTTIPGGARGIVAVGSMLDPGRVDTVAPQSPVPTPISGDEYGFHISGYSSRGPTRDGRIKPDIAAPGQSIMAARNGTTNGYVAFSGTSMASPFAAGTAALVMAADPSLNASQVRAILLDTAEDWGPPGPDVDYGHGRLNTLRAVQSALLGKMQRDGASYQELVKVANLTGPEIPYHDFGRLTGNYASKSIQIRDAKKPVAVTFLYNGSLENPINRQPVRAWVAEVRGPSDTLVGRVTAPGGARQLLVTFIPAASGAYMVTVYNVGPSGEVLFDVSAGLPPPAKLDLPVLPDPTSYEKHAASVRALQRKEAAGASPGVGLLAGLAGFAAAVAIAAMGLGFSKRR